jgi:hypothetical protein
MMTQVRSIDIDQLAKLAESAFKEESPKDLAFMFATGKSEGYLRDVLGAFLNKHLTLESFEHVTREWKKHDLSIMDGNTPLLIIEGKSWISHDAYRLSKLLTDKKSIFNGSYADASKLMETKKKFPHLRAFISTVIYGVNVDEVIDYENYNITYADSHAKGILSAGTFDELVETARSHSTLFHVEFGATRRFPLEVGAYHGMQVEADFYLTEIERAPKRSLSSEIRRVIN